MYTVQHILDKKHDVVATIETDATVLEAAQLMNERHIGALLVTRHESVIGILTERDILNRVVAEQKLASETIVKNVMTVPIACCRRDTKEDECRAVMRRKKIRHLPVIENDHLFGIISIGDVIQDESEEKDETIHYLHEYMYGTYH